MVESGTARFLAKPHRLYGREGAIASLMASFDRICQGQGEVILAPGYSGVGKTSLVREISGPVRERNGFFLEGKFNQYQRNVPYSAIRQALAQLACEMLDENEALRDQWKTTLRQAVGSLGRLLVDLAPEFEALLGPQPAVADISPLEARHRLAGVLRTFLAAVCRPEHPVVLFVDDWQWADTASFELLKQLQIGTTLRNLLVIAPYRDNEVDGAHPLVATIEELRRQNVPVSVIEIGNLSVADVLTWVTDVLQPEAENLEALAQLIHGQTGGNPFFTQAFLSYLVDFGLLRFDSSGDCWRWNIKDSEKNGLPGDVVELFRLRLKRLDRGSQDLLARAACLGARFNIGSLAAICKRNVDECRFSLLTLSNQDLVVSVTPANTGDDEWFMFVHDRVQQAAYGFIPPKDLPLVRLEIGRLLLARLSPEQLSDRLFDVVDHLNMGQALIDDPAEQLWSVELNVAAARKARAAAAYGATLEFHRAAGRFLEKPAFAEDLWNSRHELALSLHLEWAESEFLEGDRAEAEQHIDQAVDHARTPLEKAEALNVLIVQNTLTARYPEAIAAGRQALAALGIILPEDRYEAGCDAEVDLVRRTLGGRSVASLAGLPVMTHPEMRMAAKILITMGPPCYRSHQRLWGVIVPKVVNLTLQYGNIEQVGYSHPAFAGLLCWAADDFALAREFGELSTRLMTEVFHSPSDRSVYALMIGSSVRHWFHHLRKGSENYAEACEIGLQSGNLQYTAYALGHNMYCRFYQGVALDELITESKGSLAFSRTRLNQWAIDLLEGGMRIFSSLSGAAEADGAHVLPPESAYLGEVEAHRNIQVVCIYKILKTFSLLVLGRHGEALEVSDEVEQILYTVGMQGLLPWPEHVFARFLILTALAPDADQERAAERRAELTRMLAKLRLWADYCPENFEHMYRLAAAELARLDLHTTEAMKLYEQAIGGAQAGGFVQWEGVANERAARFWRERGNGLLAQMYWEQAYACFARWGCQTKLRAIEAEYREWLTADLPEPSNSDDLMAADSPVPPKSGDLMTQQARESLLDKHVHLLRTQVRQSAEARMRAELERQAEELARATEHLRAEVAARKKVEEDLRLHREELEERVRERTAALEMSLAEGKQAGEALQRLNRELHAISNCNEALMRARDERTLLDDICRIICEQAGYRMAFVGYAENDDAKTIRPVAWAGVEQGYLQQARLTWADTERGHGPAGMAIRTGESSYVQDFASDSKAIPWRENALRRGYRSAIALPLKDKTDTPFGVLIIYSTEPNAFTSEEIRLLEELAGDLAFGVIVLRDRIERKRAEAALSESEIVYRSLFTAMGEGVMLQNAEGEIVTINLAARNILGLADGEVSGRTAGSIALVCVHDDKTPFPEDTHPWMVALRSGRPQSDVVMGLGKSDGGVTWVTINSQPLISPGEETPHAVVTTIHDFTAIKEADEEIANLNHELQRQLEEFEAISYSVSHDMKIPLRAIDAFATMMLDQYKGQLAGDGERYMKVVRRNIVRMSRLIDGLLNFISQSKREMQITSVDVGAMVAEVFQELQSATPQRRIRLCVGYLPPARGDGEMIRVVLTNLVGNAFKFTAPSTVAHIEIGGVATETENVYFVRDDGVGFDARYTDKLFGVGFRLHSPDEFEGAGIGLAIVKRIIDRHGGRVWAESKVGEGATFNFTLPLSL